MSRDNNELDISSVVRVFAGVFFAGVIVWASFFYSFLSDIPIISDLIKPPSYLSYDWVAFRLILIGTLGVVISYIAKIVWLMYQQKKEDSQR